MLASIFQFFKSLLNRFYFLHYHLQNNSMGSDLARLTFNLLLWLFSSFMSSVTFRLPSKTGWIYAQQIYIKYAYACFNLLILLIIIGKARIHISFLFSTTVRYRILSMTSLSNKISNFLDTFSVYYVYYKKRKRRKSECVYRWATLYKI